MRRRHMILARALTTALNRRCLSLPAQRTTIPMPTRLSYPRPTPPPDPPVPFPIPAALAPLLAPPPDTSPPRCPPSRGSIPVLDGWTRSTHVFPAAYPRVRTLQQPEGKISIEELRARRLKHHEGRSARLESRKEVLWTVVERWTRLEAKGKGKGVTLFATHPNGMHKEASDLVQSSH